MNGSPTLKNFTGDQMLCQKQNSKRTMKQGNEKIKTMKYEILQRCK